MIPKACAFPAGDIHLLLGQTFAIRPQRGVPVPLFVSPNAFVVSPTYLGDATTYAGGTTREPASGSRVSPGRHYSRAAQIILACFDPRADGDPWDASPNPDYVYFSVTDLEGTLRTARHAEAVILRPIETQPWGERSFYCTDPFRNKLCFVAADTLFTAGLLN